MTHKRDRLRTGAKNTTICQLEDFIREHFELELKTNRRRILRNGDNVPLSAWMAGAQKTAKSKIDAVKNEQSRYPYRLPGDGARVLAWAIAHRYDVTKVQLSLIEQYVLQRYRGRYDDYPNEAGLVNQPDGIDAGKTLSPMQALEAICKALGRSTQELPLRALIDPKVTNALLLLQLKETIERNTHRVCKI